MDILHFLAGIESTICCRSDLDADLRSQLIKLHTFQERCVRFRGQGDAAQPRGETTMAACCDLAGRKAVYDLRDNGRRGQCRICVGSTPPTPDDQFGGLRDRLISRRDPRLND